MRPSNETHETNLMGPLNLCLGFFLGFLSHVAVGYLVGRHTPPRPPIVRPEQATADAGSPESAAEVRAACASLLRVARRASGACEAELEACNTALHRVSPVTVP